MARDGFVFYQSFLASIQLLPDDCQLQMFRAVCEYGLEQKEPEFTGSDKNFLSAIWMSIRPQLDANYNRYVNGSKGGCPKGITKPSMIGNQNASKQNKTKTKPEQNQTKPKEKVKEKEKDKDKEKVKENTDAQTSKRFAPPTTQEVDEYIKESNLSMSAQAFVDYYASKGWMVGSNKMKDWKAACRNWAKRESSFRPVQITPQATNEAFNRREQETAKRNETYERNRREAATPEQASDAIQRILSQFK